MAATRSALLVISVFIQVHQECTANTEANLISKLLEGYDVSARPVREQSNPVLVKLGLVLQQIINLNERQQELYIKAWMRYEWKDENLVWNTSEYGGISSLRIVPQRIWRPDITLYDDLSENPNDNDAKLFPCQIDNNGRVRWHVPKIIASSCDVNVHYYPWDEQRCLLKFGSWTYDGSKLDMVNQSSTGDLTYYKNSSEWNIISFNVKRNNIKYNCCPYPYPDVTFTIHIRRKPMYYLVNLILPAFFITITTVLVFYLPPESGEKVSLGVTVLLALTVFLLLVAESVPKSETIPLIGKYFESVIILMALSSALTVIILNIHHRGIYSNEVPAWIRTVALDWLARPLCLKTKIDANLSKAKTTRTDVNINASDPENNGSCDSATGHGIPFKMDVLSNKDVSIDDEKSEREHPMLLAILNILREFQSKSQGREREEACKTDWMLVACVIDRLLLYVFFVLTLVVTCVILLEHPNYKEPPIA